MELTWQESLMATLLIPIGLHLLWKSIGVFRAGVIAANGVHEHTLTEVRGPVARLMAGAFAITAVLMLLGGLVGLAALMLDVLARGSSAS